MSVASLVSIAGIKNASVCTYGFLRRGSKWTVFANWRRLYYRIQFCPCSHDAQADLAGLPFLYCSHLKIKLVGEPVMYLFETRAGWCSISGVYNATLFRSSVIGVGFYFVSLGLAMSRQSGGWAPSCPVLRTRVMWWIFLPTLFDFIHVHL